MTRINIHIPVKNLCNQHLVAEYREAKRIPNMIKSGKAIVKDIPDCFTLGRGHVKFFYNKLGYLKNRYEELYNECIRRGFNIQDYRNCFDNIPAHLCNNIPFSLTSKKLVEKRIEEKLVEMKNIHYLCSKIDAEKAIKLLRR